MRRSRQEALLNERERAVAEDLDQLLGSDDEIDVGLSAGPASGKGSGSLGDGGAEGEHLPSSEGALRQKALEGAQGGNSRETSAGEAGRHCDGVKGEAGHLHL